MFNHINVCALHVHCAAIDVIKNKHTHLKEQILLYVQFISRYCKCYFQNKFILFNIAICNVQTAKMKVGTKSTQTDMLMELSNACWNAMPFHVHRFRCCETMLKPLRTFTSFLICAPFHFCVCFSFSKQWILRSVFHRSHSLSHSVCPSHFLSFYAEPSSFILFNRRCCVTWPFILTWQRVLNYYCVMYSALWMYIGLHRKRNAVKRIVKTSEHLSESKRMLNGWVIPFLKRRERNDTNQPSNEWTNKTRP